MLLTVCRSIVVIHLINHSNLLCFCWSKNNNNKNVPITFQDNRNNDNDISIYLNYGIKPMKHSKSITIGNKLENAVVKSKVDILSGIFKNSVQKMRYKNKKNDIVFLIDSSSSVGKDNFLSEIKFVRKLLGDFTVSYNHTRVAIVTFSSQGKIIRHVDQITVPKEENDKCKLLNYDIPNIHFVGGGTYTFGALREAKEIFIKARKHSKKIIFLITDGFSNGRNPVPIAQKLKNDDITIITFGIQTGNYAELYNISSNPGEEHSFLLDSFIEFESLARKALHNDYKIGHSIGIKEFSFCDILCDSKENKTNSCCDDNAECTCGTTSGHYSCVCAPGYYGSGLQDNCQLCPNGTYWHWNVCKPCPDINHITKYMPAINISFCVCKTGFKPRDNNRCEVITCPKLKAPENGYFVKHPSGCGHVLNAACGARCKSGYQLTGSSIRLCQENGTWSGIEANCILKTCPRLSIPYYGMVTCKNTDLNQFFDYTPRNETFMKIYHNDELRITEPMPIDTDCNFKCGPGFYMVGSGMRNCLPLSKWDGLHTTCKQILCTPLPIVNFGEYDPSDCTVQKVSHGTNCTLICQHGFEIKGPVIKSCGGKRNGVWINRNKYPKCVDVMPPSIKCPNNFTIPMSDNDNYALIKLFPPPNVTDNSNLNVTYWLKPAFKPEGLKLTLGDHMFFYITVDSFKNKAKCNFTVTVIDMTPPIIDNCIDPLTIYIPVSPLANKSETFIDWDDPIIYDNSNTELFVNKSHSPGYLGIGIHRIHYIAIDPSDNQNECIINVTVKELNCDVLEAPQNGQSICVKNLTHTWCEINCRDGYAIYDDIADTYLENFQLYCENDYPKWKYEIIPDCTILEEPNSIEQIFNISLDSETSICNDSVKQNELQNEIVDQIKTHLCGDQKDDCEIVTNIPECLEIESLKFSNDVTNTSFYNVLVKRDVMNQLLQMSSSVPFDVTTPSLTSHAPRRDRLRQKTNMKIKVYTKIGKKLGLWNRNATRTTNLRLIKSELQNISGNERLQKKLSELNINIKNLKLDEIYLCKNGSVSKKRVCVQCPRGTFHNDILNVCQLCSLHFYNNLPGQMECKQCPEHFSTRKYGSKFLSDCLQQCPPGTIAKIKVPRKYRANQKPQKSVMPFCRKCVPGEYQSLYDQIICNTCPENFTSIRGATSVNDCYPKRTLPCSLEPPVCGPYGTCVPELRNNYLYSCTCEENYIGSHCEQQIDICLSAPCQNGGTCNLIKNGTTFQCTCPSLFKGDYCELNHDQCDINVCQNGGSCIETNGFIVCECSPGYEGEFCEIQINYCESSPCDTGTCLNAPEGYICKCPPGIIGRRCHLRPCDYLPCHQNAICIDLQIYNAVRSSYVCKCPKGLKGFDCLQIDNPCDENPCRNNGKCTPLYLRDPYDINPITPTIIDEQNYEKFQCQCSPYFYGEFCETFTIPDFVMEFTKSGVSDFVQLQGPSHHLNEISFCSWIQTNDSFNYGTVISYATENSDNMFTLTDYNGFVLYINGSNIITDIQINDNMWHFVCITWMSDNGFYEIYVDGTLRNTGYNLSTNSLIQSNGTLILGQEQDIEGTGFSESESFVGKLAYLDIWDRFLAGREVLEYYMSCEPYQGNLYSWTDFKHRVNGGVKILPSPFCKPCGKSLVLANGFVRYYDNRATHFCYDGYKLQGPIFRECLRSSQWSLPAPICKSIECDHIPDIINGQTLIERNSYGDIAIFHCNEGFSLNGQSNRSCLSNGSWSGFNPECISKIQCEKLPILANTMIIYANEKGPVSEQILDTLPIGTFAEIQCVNDTMTSGENFLTCLENGLWDFPIPLCFKSVDELLDNISLTIHKTTTQNVYNFNTNSNPVTFSPASSLSSSSSSSSSSSTSSLPPTPITNDKIPLADIKFWTHFIKLFNYGCGGGGDHHSDINENVSNKYSDLCFFINTNSLKFSKLSGFESPDHTEFNNIDEKLLLLLNLIKDHFNKSTDNISFDYLFEDLYYSKNDKIFNFSMKTENSIRFLICFYIETLIIDDNGNKGVIDNAGNGNDFTKEIKSILLKIGNMLYETYFNDINELEIGKIDFDDKLRTTTEKMSTISTFEKAFLDSTAAQSPIITTVTTTTIALSECNLNQLPTLPNNSIIHSIENVNNVILINSIIDDENQFDPRFINLPLNTIVRFSCIKGYALKGLNFSECSDANQWNTVHFECEQMCNKPRLLINMEQPITDADTFYSIGQEYAIKCIEGFVLYGLPTIQCQSNLIWTKIRSQCTKISCNKPKLPADSIITSGSSYLYLDKLLIECDDETVTEIQCQSNGHWNPSNIC